MKRTGIWLLAPAIAAAMLTPDAAAWTSGTRKVVAGPRISAIVNPGFNQVLAWGTNSQRQLGPNIPSTTPYSFNGNIQPNGFIRSLAFGGSHGIVALDDGTVQVWGALDNYTGASPGVADPTPRTIAYSLLRSARQVAAGNSSSYVLLEGGTIYSFGSNAVGQLGTAAPGSGSTASPYPIPGLSNIVQVDAKCETAAAVDDSGRLFTWGRNTDGQLGIGASGGSSGSPTHVLSDVAQVAVGCNFMMALLRTGQVYAWGANGVGQLGQNNTVPRNVPTFVPVANAVSIAAGYEHALAVLTDGRLGVWGRNSEGQLGIGSFAASQLSPTYANGVTTAVAVAGGDYHSVIGAHDRGANVDVWTVGYNDNGQIGSAPPAGTSTSTFAAMGYYAAYSSTLRRTGVRNFNENDVFWYNTSTGENGYWQGTTNTYRPMRTVQPGWAVIGTGDINFDDVTEVFFYNAASGEVYFWSPHGAIAPPPNFITQIVDEGSIGAVTPSTGWRPQHVGDMDGDGVADIVWRNVNTGGVAIWYLTTDGRVGLNIDFGPVPLDWAIVKTGDFDGNGVDDVLWRNNATGQVNIWFKTGVRTQVNDISLGPVALQWSPQAVVDLDGDGRSDIFWRNTSTGQTFIWYMAGNAYYGASGPLVSNLAWNVVATASLGTDEPQSRLLWRNSSTGEVWRWDLGNRPAGATFTVTEGSMGGVGLAWKIGQ